jgi:uncharacterized membrane protein YgcG
MSYSFRVALAKNSGGNMSRKGILPLAVLLFPLLIVALVKPCSSAQSERIVDFRSKIQVHRDGSMSVTEDIRVVCARKEIKRGIYRDFPTKYKDRYGNTIRVGFEVVSVLRDNRPEPYHIKKRSNGERVYIGQKNVLLNPGTYTYTITYKTYKQLGFFEDFDELYWNVTGNGWAFIIEHVEAAVELPHGAQILREAAYTGRAGQNGQEYATGFDEYGNITFFTTRKLMPREGLSIAVAWPKGFVTEPTTVDKFRHMWKDNHSAAAALIGLLVLISFYILAWFKVGKDPAEGTIIPLFSPPKWVSPALARLIRRLGSLDDKLFAVAVVNMAVKGFLTIKEDANDVFALEKTGAGEAPLSGGEVKIARKLFGSGKKIKLKQANHAKIGAAKKELRKYLMKNARNKYFILNSGFFLTGIVITGLTLGAVILEAHQLGLAIFMCIWLSIWTTGCFVLALQVIRGWKLALGTGGIKALRSAGALAKTIFALPFFAGELFGLWAFSNAVSLLAAVTLVVIIIINVLFCHLLKAPTLAGRNLMDEIEGFRLYLSVGEKERLNILNPPEKTPELFEKYLPYALALDVEHQWSEQFANVLAVAATDGGYRPAWYTGRSWRATDMTGFASSLGTSFAGAISSASTAPGSSSGSSGGGSSGGGGGGGGGGGW